MSAPVDLRQLAVRRDAPTVGPRRHFGLRFALPGAVLLGFAALIAWSARDSLLPAHPVAVVPVLTSSVELRQAGTPLFQAAGWVEPRPTATLVTALAEGVIDKLLVVEGQEIKAGQVVAELYRADAQLTLDAAAADLRLREDETEAIFAKVEADRVYLPFQIAAAEARQKLARVDLESKKNAAVSLPPITLHKAQGELDAATAAHGELHLRQQRLQRESSSCQRLREAFRQGKASGMEADSSLTETEAAVRSALTRVVQARVAHDTAKLRLERMTVKAPSDGRVLALLARPGMRLMGLAPNSMHEASTILSLYDPRSLQVRADVRFENLPQVIPGSPVRIDSPAVGQPLDGAVLFPTSQADIQKNTLQVKVSLDAPPSVLKPDMLVQVTFLAPEQPSGPAAPSEKLRLLLPRPAIVSAEGGAFVWLADRAAGQARRRPVKTGAADGDLVEIVEGLNAADKVIVGGRDGLQDGARIRVTGEEADTTRPAPAPSSPKHH